MLMLTVRWLQPSCQVHRPPSWLYTTSPPPSDPSAGLTGSKRACQSSSPAHLLFSNQLAIIYKPVVTFPLQPIFYLILIQPTCYFQKGGMGSLITFATTAFLPSLTYGLLGWTGWIRDGENGQIGSFFIWDSCFMLHADNSTVSKSISNVIIFLFKSK